MAKIYKPNRKFKIGDLVINDFPLHIGYEETKIKEGEIGLVVGMVSFSEENISGYDYVVLMRGREIFFFEQELKPHKPKGDKK